MQHALLKQVPHGSHTGSPAKTKLKKHPKSTETIQKQLCAADSSLELYKMMLCWILSFPQSIDQILQQAGPDLAVSGSHRTPVKRKGRVKSEREGRVKREEFDAENSSLNVQDWPTTETEMKGGAYR